MAQRLLILLDDEPVTSRALALDLEDAGYRVSTAVDRREVLRRIQSEPIDLLIADESRESAGDGPVVDEVRRIRPEAKVLLMTTHPDRDGKEGKGKGKGRPASPVARIRKPFDLEEFRATVGRLLGEVEETNGSAR